MLHLLINTSKGGSWTVLKICVFNICNRNCQMYSRLILVTLGSVPSYNLHIKLHISMHGIQLKKFRLNNGTVQYYGSI